MSSDQKGSSIFGGAGDAGKPAFSFGAPPFGTQQPSSGQAGFGSGLFGTPNTSKTVFPGNSSTPVGNPPTGNPTAPPGGSLFGGAGSSNTSTAFGGISAPGSSLFGNKTFGATGGNTTSTPFAGLAGLGGAAGSGSSNQPATSGLFGAAASAAPSATTAATAPASTAATTTPALSFGSLGANPATSGTSTGGFLAGIKPAAATPSLSSLGQAQGTNADATKPPQSLFGQGTAGSGLFGAAATPSTSSGTASSLTGLASASNLAGGAASGTGSGTTTTSANPTATSNTPSFGLAQGTNTGATKPPQSLFGLGGTGSGLFGTSAAAASGSGTAPSLTGLGSASNLASGATAGTGSGTTTASTNPTAASINQPAAPAGSATTAGPTPATTTASLGDAAKTANSTTPAAASGSSKPFGSSFLGLGGTPKPPGSSDVQPPKPASTAAPTAGGTKTAAASNSTLASSIAGPKPTPASVLKNKSMDDIVTRWATDLAKYQKEFQTLAEKVAQWDNLLVANSDKVSQLYTATFQSIRDASELEKQLSDVESRQKEMESWLVTFENEVHEMLVKGGVAGFDGGVGLQGVDQERERTYKLAEKLTDRVGELHKDISDVIEELNGISSLLNGTGNSEDPLSQMVRTLNGNLALLQSIEAETADLQAKVVTATRAVSKARPAWSTSFGASGNAHSDGFYQSFRAR